MGKCQWIAPFESYFVIAAKPGIREMLASREVGGSEVFLDSGSSPE